MAARKYSSFADIPALEAEKQKILELYNEVKTGALSLSKIGIKLNSADSVSGLADLTDEFEKQTKVINEQQKQLIQLTQKLGALTTTEAKQIEAVKQVTALTKALTKEETKASLLRQAEYNNLQQQRVANTELNKSIQLRVKIRQAEAGSVDQLSLKYEKVTKILNKLSAEQRNSARGQGLEKFAADLQKQLKDADARVGTFRRNVGNYAGSLADGFELVRREISNLQRQAQQLEQNGDPTGAAKVRQDTERLEGILRVANKEGQSFSRTVSGIEKAYQGLASSGRYSNEFLAEFRKFAAESKDQAADLRDEIKALSSDTHSLDLAVETVSTLASTFEAASGFAALTGANTEEVEKSIQKLVAIQSVANGIREVGEQITKRGTAANKAYNFVLQQGTILFGKGSTAAQRFGAALKGIVILAVIGFIIQLIEYLGQTDTGAEEATKSVEKLNKELENNKKILASFDKESGFDFTKRIEELKKAGLERLKLAKSESDTEKITKENRKKEFEEELAFKKNTIDELRRRQEEADDAEIREFQQQNEFLRVARQKGIKEISKERADAMRERIKIVEEENQAAKQALEDAQRDLILFQAQEQTKLTEIELAELEKRRKKQADLAKEERKAQYELFIYRQQLIKEGNEVLSSPDSTANEAFKKEAAKKEYDATIAIIQRTRDYQLKEEAKTATQRVLINEKADDEILRAKILFQSKLTQIRIDDLKRQKDEIDEIAAYLNQQQADRFQVQLDTRTKEFEKEQAFIQRNQEEELESAAKHYAEGNKTKAEYDKRKLEIETSYQRALLQSQLRFYEDQLKLLTESGDDQTEALGKIAEIKKQLAELDANKKTNRKDELEEERKALQELRDAYLDFSKTIASTIGDVLSGLVDKRKNQIQEQIDEIDRLKAKEIEAANKSAETEEKKAARIIAIEATAQSKKDILERRQRTLDRQKAIYQRAEKAFEITIDGIKTVSAIKLAALSAINPIVKAAILAQIPLAIATSAAALVATLATPIPAYYKGIEATPRDEIASTAERGRELVRNPDGTMELHEKPGYRFLKKNTRVYSNEVTEQLLKTEYNITPHKSGYMSIINFDDGNIVGELKEIRKRTGVIIQNNPAIETTAYWFNQMKN